MLHFSIGFAFLMLLLIPIGFFMISLIYLTGEELRKKNQTQHKNSDPVTQNISKTEKLRVVK